MNTPQRKAIVTSLVSRNMLTAEQTEYVKSTGTKVAYAIAELDRLTLSLHQNAFNLDEGDYFDFRLKQIAQARQAIADFITYG